MIAEQQEINDNPFADAATEAAMSPHQPDDNSALQNDVINEDYSCSISSLVSIHISCSSRGKAQHSTTSHVSCPPQYQATKVQLPKAQRHAD